MVRKTSCITPVGKFINTKMDPVTGTIFVKYEGDVPMRRIIVLVGNIVDSIHEITKVVRGKDSFELIVSSEFRGDATQMGTAYMAFFTKLSETLQRNSELCDELKRTMSEEDVLKACAQYARSTGTEV